MEPEEFPGTQEAFDHFARTVVEQGKQIEKLTEDIQALRSLIEQMVRLGPMNDREVQGWEVSNVLVRWANGDEG